MKKGRIWAAIPGGNSAALVVGGEGEVVEKLEETKLYQLVGLDGVGAAGFEVAGEDRGATVVCAAAAALRCGRSGEDRPEGTSGGRGNSLGSWLRRRRGGEGCSTVR